MNYIILLNEWESSEKIILKKEDLDFLNDKVNGDKPNSKIEIIPKGDNQYILRATSWIGTIKIPNSKTLIIRPKVGNLNFIKMLVYSENLHDVKFFDMVSASEGEYLVDFMAKLYLEVVNSLVSEGLYKNYVSIIEEIPSLKGRLLVTQNIRYPRLTHEKFWCEYDEISSDVLENQILLYCSKLLSSLVIDKSIKSQLHDFELILENHGVSEVVLESYHLDLVSLQKLNEHYEGALQLCEFIIRLAWYDDFTSDTNVPIFGFLYNMNSLFQNFVTKVVREVYPKFTVNAKPTYLELLERITITNQYDAVDVRKITLPKLIPDIVVGDKKSKKPILVIDTKYKDSVSNNDIYQSISYSLALECPVLLLVPKIDSSIKDGFQLRPLYEKKAQIHIRSIDFSDHVNFITEMKTRIYDELVDLL